MLCPSAVFFVHTSIGCDLTVMLYFLVVWLGAIFSGTQTAAIFYYHWVTFLQSILLINVLYFSNSLLNCSV